METSQSWIANVEILNSLLRKESWYNTFWAKFSGNVDISERDNGNPVYKPSGKPIEILNQFIAQGRDNMLIPFIKQLTGSPVYGDTVLKGTGEDQSLHWLRASDNQYRKAVMKKSGSMSEQRQKIFKLYEEARPQLADWFTKWENQAIFQTFYEGVSPNLSTGTASDGLGLVRRYHPNWYCNDDDVLTAVGTENQLTVESELDTMESNTNKHMDAEILAKLRVKMMELKIPQIVSESGHKYWALIVHPQQLATLQADSEYNNGYLYGNMGKGAGSMPQGHGMAGYYAGFCSFEEIVGIRSWDNTADANNFFGATTTTRFAATAAGTGIYNAIAFGASAIGKGVASDLSFTDEVDDHKNTIEIGGAVINGYNRADFFSETLAAETSAFSKNNPAVGDASGHACINQSSLIFATKDPE